LHHIRLSLGFHIEKSLPSPGAGLEYDLSKFKVGEVQPTEKLAAMLKDYGGFPDSVLVRQEMKILWGVLVEKMITNKGKVAIVGSPGVGKSVVAVLFSLFLATVKRENIFLLRTVKEGSFKINRISVAVICFRGPNNMVVYPDVGNFSNAEDLLRKFAMKCERDNEPHRLVIDGLNQDQLSSVPMLGTFDLLSTSAQYSRKKMIPTKCAYCLPGRRLISSDMPE
jgi:hypothetical protein